jgi:hypothetical protein
MWMGLRPNRDRVDQELIEAREQFRAALAKMARPRDWFDDLPPGFDKSAARAALARYHEMVPTKPPLWVIAKMIAARSGSIETKEPRPFRHALSSFSEVR